MARKVEDRHRCRCQCDCDGSAAGELCPLCGDGFHRAPRAARRILNGRLELWSQILVELTPDSSSGISGAALGEARKRYEIRAKGVR